jgi:putative membrane protein
LPAPERLLYAALHLLALGIGLAAVWSRGQALKGNLDNDGLQRVFLADTFWGVAAGLWIITGLIRAFTGIEKGSAYYLSNSMFLVKMGLLGLILILEVWPMTTLIRWRIKLRQGQRPDTNAAPAIARISQVEVALIILMVFTATAMARGIGADL